MKSDRILDSSLAVFCRYGFHKTSMLDIADAAGISRAALYLHFKNKEDVFRSGSVRAHATVMHAIEREFAGEGDALDRIETALALYFTGLLEQIGESPHGGELFDANAELLGDVALKARARLIGLITSAVQEAEESGAIVLANIGAESAQLATLLVATLGGLKHEQAPLLPALEGMALQMRLVRASVASAR